MLINPNLGISSYIQNPVNKNQNSKRPAFNKAQFINLQPLKRDTVSFKASLPSSGPLLEAAEEGLARQVPLEQRMEALLNKIKQMRNRKNCQIGDLLFEVMSSGDPELNQVGSAFLQRVNKTIMLNPFKMLETSKAVRETDLQDHPLAKKMGEMIKRFADNENETNNELRELLSEIPENSPERKICSNNFKNIRKQEMEDINLHNLRFQITRPSTNPNQLKAYYDQRRSCIDQFLGKLDDNLPVGLNEKIDLLEREENIFSQLASNQKLPSDIRFLMDSIVGRINFRLFILDLEKSQSSVEEKMQKIEEEALSYFLYDAELRGIEDVLKCSKQALNKLSRENPEKEDLVIASSKRISEKFQSLYKKSMYIDEIEKSKLNNRKKIVKIREVALRSNSEEVSFRARHALRNIKNSDPNQVEFANDAISQIKSSISE